MPEKEKDRSWAEIDGPAIRHNLGVVREQVGSSVQIMAVIKANAYGHGIENVIPALSDSDLFAVANAEEARAVRKAGGDKPILLLGPCLPSEYASVATDSFIPTVSSADEAESFKKAASSKNVSISFAVDNGMGRIGAWIDAAAEEINHVTKIPGVTIHSVSTHLPSADEDEVFTKKQLEEFAAFSRAIKKEHPQILFHALNSAGIQNFPEYAFDIVRPGLMLYGATSVPEFFDKLRPALTWKAHITLVRDIGEGRSVSYGRTFVTVSPIKAATVPVGYADGYARQLSEQDACVIVAGERCPVLGRVTMDQIVVDVTGLDAKVGDEVILIGSSDEASVRAEELAERAGTIPWHIFTGIGDRVRRIS
ncbi:MAG: alanine racemase [Chthoniobacterales bacterium]